MSYPKPLSERTLERRYAESGLSAEQRAYLHLFFSACSNLYGAIHLRDVWEVYKQIKDEKPRFHRKDLIAFASVVQREEQPYYVLDEDELYVDGLADASERYIVNRQLVGKGAARFYMVYELLKNQGNRPYNVPENFISNSIVIPSSEELRLLDFIGNLKVSRDEVERWGIMQKCEEKGRMLCEIETLSQYESFIIDYEKRPSFKEHFRQLFSGTKAERLLRRLKLRINVGSPSFTDTIRFLFEEIDETGVALSEKEDNILLGLIQDFNNNSRLWHNCGWAPRELSEYMAKNGLRPKESPKLAIGPNMRERFREHPEELEEFLRKAKAMGIEVDIKGKE